MAGAGEGISADAAEPDEGLAGMRLDVVSRRGEDLQVGGVVVLFVAVNVVDVLAGGELAAQQDFHHQPVHVAATAREAQRAVAAARTLAAGRPSQQAADSGPAAAKTFRCELR